MTDVNLTTLHPELLGNWPVTPPERVVAARIVAVLPAAPPPGTDVVTRWNTMVETVLTAVTAMRDAPELAIGPEGRELPRGQVDMWIMPHVLAQSLTMRKHYVEWLNAMPDRGPTIMAQELDSIEPQVEQLRQLLTRVATGA